MTTKDKTLVIKDAASLGTQLTVTLPGPNDKWHGTADILLGFVDCSHGERVTVTLKDAHRLGKFLLSLKKTKEK